MKVVLFCGGQGMRMRDFSERVPKPLVPVGPRPILWHMMKYYAHFGHDDFVLCLGYGDRQIKEYFLEYKEWLSNDFVMTKGGEDVQLLNTDLDSWRITFVNTGLNSEIGERLRRVRDHLDGVGTFLCNYSDCLTDLYLPAVIDQHHEMNATATMTVVPPTTSFHVVDADEGGRVRHVGPVNTSGMWINGGYIVLDEAIFDDLRPGEDLVGGAFPRLADAGKLHCYRHSGNWIGVDTFKERQYVEDLYLNGNPFWAVWKRTCDGQPC